MYLTIGSQLIMVSFMSSNCSMKGLKLPSVVVDLVTVTRCVDNVQTETNAILLNN